ncbi:ROK family protein [soil metagenome]
MAKQKADPAPLPAHGAAVLPSVEVDNYSLEVEDKDGFIGDKASKGAFLDILDKWRKPLKENDPLSKKPSDEISKKELASMLTQGTATEAALVHSAIEEFAGQLANVVSCFLRLKEWRDTEAIVIGGGFQASRVGQVAVARCELILKAQGLKITLGLIHNDPDDAGLIGSAHLLPLWMLDGYDAILALDIGGTNIRAGIVRLNLKKSLDLANAVVVKREQWRHRDDEPKRDEAVERTVEMLKDLMSWTEKENLRLAPVVGVGCPGRVQEDGSILRGAQNLPGNWESSRFKLPNSICAHIPMIGNHDTMVVMHNDAVVQGLSELPYMKDRRRWGVLTIGTGLGNARFTNRAPNGKTAKEKPAKD